MKILRKSTLFALALVLLSCPVPPAAGQDSTSYVPIQTGEVGALNLRGKDLVAARNLGMSTFYSPDQPCNPSTQRLGTSIAGDLLVCRHDIADPFRPPRWVRSTDPSTPCAIRFYWTGFPVLTGQ